MTCRDMENMPYTLDQFTQDCHEALTQDPGPVGREQVRVLLGRLLADEAFVRKFCIDSRPGLHLLFEDPELAFQVLAHVNEKPRVSPPHDHGDSWAIYGQATEYTDVTEWQRRDDGADKTHADLQPARMYRLSPGQVEIYQDGRIHSIDHPARSCFIRVTGTNLDRIPRIMIDPQSGVVTQMGAQRAT
jgi:predicted metal-dependent enzyme (double-stranded beta helix superfamily)